MPSLDISIVLYRNTVEQLSGLLASLARQRLETGVIANVLLLNNDVDDAAAVEALLGRCETGDLAVSLRHASVNGGFGTGQNHNFQHGEAEYFLVLNPDCVLEDDAIACLLAAAQGDDGVAAWEMRQLPHEHPKLYDPVSGATDWVACAAVLFRRSAYAAVGGFDERIFMYAEDVDLSWRLRAAGWGLRYVPQATTRHDSYANIRVPKPLQAIESVYGSLCLRARYGSRAQVMAGLGFALLQMLAPERFPGRRRLLWGAVRRFLKVQDVFRTSGESLRGQGFLPYFSQWNFAPHRPGAFHQASLPTPALAPLVSIVIRLAGPAPGLLHAVRTALGQTYRHLEVVVVENGPGAHEPLLRPLLADERLRYHAIGDTLTPAAFGKLALQQARGAWINLLPPEGLLFADHVETLLIAATEAGAKPAFGLVWEASDWALPTSRKFGLAWEPAPGRTAVGIEQSTPIQAVLFPPSAIARYGAVETASGALADWQFLALQDMAERLLCVAKVTSVLPLARPLPAFARHGTEELQRVRLLQTLRGDDVLPASWLTAYRRRHTLCGLYGRASLIVLAGMAGGSQVVGWLEDARQRMRRVFKRGVI
ncbi:glycosyltransferase family 2 protein [Chitinimonas naiadis]